ncbi:Cytochrome c-type biogenesis protein CcmE, heme chaperone [hydrothermal vent metagenome]|uniref:Cytochrome c-type biogenesis protein CcmE, heme chaperone n=1 Tax=hydrothermal vent metagenome TaxID=652676 RepID=A0A1W1BWN3_9ZZZZ
MNIKRKKKLSLIFLFLTGIGITVFLGLKAFEENLLYFYSTTDVVEGKSPQNRSFRLGGMVVEKSVKRDGLKVEFVLTDYKKQVKVSYKGILPDLFREGQGIVATGVLKKGAFIASEVLAKHDENYMPPEVAESLKKKK